MLLRISELSLTSREESEKKENSKVFQLLHNKHTHWTITKGQIAGHGYNKVIRENANKAKIKKAANDNGTTNSGNEINNRPRLKDECHNVRTKQRVHEQ